MLNIKTLKRVTSILSHPDNEKTLYHRKPRGLLGQLSRTVNIGDYAHYEVGLDDTEFVESLDHISFMNQTNTNIPFSESVDESVKFLSEKLGETITHARTIVRPDVMLMHEKVEDRLKHIRVTTSEGTPILFGDAVEDRFNIKVCDVPNAAVALYDSEFANAGRNAVASELDSRVISKIHFKHSELERINGSLFKSMLTTTQELLTEFHESVGMRGNIHISNSVFCLINSSDSYHYNDSVADAATLSNATFKDHLHCLLFVNHMISRSPDLVGLSSLEYHSGMTDIRNLLLFRLNAIRHEYSNLRKGNRVIVTSHYSTRNAIVFKPNYEEWLEQGGVKEAIYGRIITDDDVNVGEKLMDNIPTYLLKFKVYTKYQNIEAEKNTLYTFRRILTDVFETRELNPEEYKAGMSATGTVASSFKSRKASEIIDNATMSDVADTRQIILSLICKACYPHTSAYVFLDALESAMCGDSDLKPEEAVTIASISLMVDFLHSQWTK